MKRAVTALALAAVVLTGCASETTTGQAPETLAPTIEENPTSEPAPEPDPEPTEPAPTESQAVPCEDLMFQRAQSTIRSQQEALGNGDFQDAWGFASPSFRSSVTVDAFQGIIEDSYPFLLDNPDLAFLECQRQDSTAFFQVEVAGSPTVVMVYRVVLNEDVWFIDAASIAGSREDVTT